jgi:hypothetical protein
MDFKKKLAIELGITAVLIVGLLFGILIFASKLKTSAIEMVKLREELALRSKSLNSVAALRSEYDMKVKERMKVLVSSVPVKDQLINIAKDFQLISSKSELQSTFTFVGESTATNDSLGKVTFKLSGEGSFEKLIDFISVLQNFHYLSSFDSFSLLRKQEENSTLSTQGSIYFRN